MPRIASREAPFFFLRELRGLRALRVKPACLLKTTRPRPNPPGATRDDVRKRVSGTPGHGAIEEPNRGLVRSPETKVAKCGSPSFVTPRR
jgi:hypothetical protein